MKRVLASMVFLMALALAAAGCSKGGAPHTPKQGKAPAPAKSAEPGAASDAASQDPGARDAQSESSDTAAEPPGAQSGQSASAVDKDAARTLVNDVLDPCGTGDWEAVAAAFPDTVEYNEWGYDRELPRDVFLDDVYRWRCEALGSPEMYETIPVQQRIVEVIAAGPGGHKFAHEFYPPGTGVTEEDAMRCDHVVPPGEARVLVADRTLQGGTLSWPAYGDWEGLMYYVKEINGVLKIYKFGSCPAEDTMDLSGSGDGPLE